MLGFCMAGILLSALVIVHCLFPKKRMASGARQGNLIKIISGMNGMAIVFWAVIAQLSSEPFSRFLPPLVYSLVVFNAAAYAYFHVFNMSETARRIRILQAICAQPGLRERDLALDYSPQDMVKGRVDRLIGLGEIERDPHGHVRIRRRRLLIVAYLFHKIQRFIIGRNGYS